MFARVKTSGQYQYLQIVQNRREGTKTIQRVVATIGRMDQIQKKGEIESLVRSLSRFSEKVLLVLSGKSDVRAEAKKIGPALICERLWNKLEIGKIIRRLLGERKFEFDVERAIFLTVLHRLFVSGSDRSCDRWHRDYLINGIDGLSLHHLYRAMAFLGEELEDQKDCTPFAPRCIKDLIEEDMFLERRDLFPVWIAFSSTRLPSTSREKEARPSASWATVRIIAPTSVRWWWGSSWTNMAIRSALRCGRGIRPTLRRLFRSLRDCGAGLRSVESASFRIGE